MQADKLEFGGMSAWEVPRESMPAAPQEQNGDRSSRRHRSRSPRNDDRRSSTRRYDDDRGDRRSSRRNDDSYSSSSSRRYNNDNDDRRRGGDRDRERDSRDSHRGGDRRDRDRDRDYRDRGDRDGRGGGGGRGDRRDRDDDRGGRGGGRGGGGGGGGGGSSHNNANGVEVFGAGNAARSPTPEATIPISKRKRTKTAWDIKAPGFESFSTLQAKMTGIFNLPGQTRPTTSGGFNPMNQPVPLPDIHLASASSDMNNPNAGAAYARQARRLYVGNITLHANEQNVNEFFNIQMRENGWAVDDDPAGAQGPDPVVSVQVNHDKSYAFVEFRSAAESSKAMGFDGIVFQGQVLKIRRPKDYVGNDFSGTTHMPGVVSTNVPDTPNKIFVGGLPSYLNDVQVMELLQSFGELRSFNLVKEGNTNQSKGFAFCEYVDPSVTDIACQGLNGMELGDRYLVVQRAAIGANPAKQGMYGNMDVGSGAHQLNKIAPNIIAAATAGEAVPTRVLQMLNMVAPEELTDKEEYGEILEDIREECGKYGSVLEVKVPKPIIGDNGKIDARASESVEDLGKVFVMFESVEETKKAMMSIAGRQFGGRSIICAYADEEKMV